MLAYIVLLWMASSLGAPTWVFSLIFIGMFARAVKMGIDINQEINKEKLREKLR